jgi:hypothetical protein
VDRRVIARFDALSPRGKAVLIVAILLLAPLAGWLGYRFGLYGRH